MTIKDAIGRLGRPAMIDALGVGQSHISNRIDAGSFPAAWFHELDKLARKQGWEIPRELFNWKSAA